MSLVIEATSRKDLGKGASRRLRRLADLVPAIVYGAGKEPAPINLEHKEILKALKKDEFFSQILTLKLDGNDEQVILKDMQRHVYKPKVLHIDFLRIDANTKLTTKVALHFVNEKEAPGIADGGVISHMITDIEISCLPKDLPESLEADLSKLELGATYHLSDITLPAGVSIVELGHDNDQAVASIHTPREVVIEEGAPVAPSNDDDAEAGDSKES